jgi:Arc/MetJ-type ribon-helix-helix transcriptional regulator
MILAHGALWRMMHGNRKEAMKSLTLDLPDKLAEELTKLVREGWFRSEDELVRAALSEFLRSHRFELTERFQREDIAWALREKENPK